MVSVANDDSSDPLSGPQPARVIVPRAVVYSDIYMNSPLGYISNNKLIMVGRSNKTNPDLVPLVVYGRLAFIELKNIQYTNESVNLLNSKRGAPREHNIDTILGKPEEKISVNNSAYFHLHQFSAGEQTSNLFGAFDGTSQENFKGFGTSLIHRQSDGRFFWGGGLEYNTISSANIDFYTLMINPIFGYTPLLFPSFLIDLSFSLDFSATAQLKLNNNSENNPTPFLYGPQLMARIVFFPQKRYHFTSSLGYRVYKVTKASDLTDAKGLPIDGITNAGGMGLAIGFAIEI
jgi:hypothetical protein